MARNGGAQKCLPAIEAALRESYPQMELHQTEGPGHATQLARESLEAGADLVIAVGGDGTSNEVLAGFVAEDGRMRFPDACLGVIAAGTGGDLRRMFGDSSAEDQAARIAQASRRRVDYGIARYTDPDGSPRMRPFVNVASVGISGLVGRYIGQASRAFGSKAAYTWASLKAIAVYENCPVEIRVNGGEARRVDLTLMCLGNGQYFGAGMWVCPEAELDNGMLDSILLPDFNRRELVSVLSKVRKGRHLGYPGLEAGRISEVELTPLGDSEVLIEIDGEQTGRLPARFEIVRQGLRLQIV